MGRITFIRSGNGSVLGGWAICCAAESSSCWSLPSGSSLCPRLQVEQRNELRWDFAPSAIGGPLHKTQTVIKHFFVGARDLLEQFQVAKRFSSRSPTYQWKPPVHIIYSQKPRWMLFMICSNLIIRNVTDVIAGFKRLKIDTNRIVDIR